MTSRTAVPAIFLLVLATGACFAARTAEEFFHGASHLYVAGKIQEASVEAEEGLRANPGDAKLRTLAEHLRKMKDQQRGNQSQKNQDPNDKQNRDKNGADKNKPDGGQDDPNKNRQGENGDKKGDRNKERPDDPKNEEQKPGEGNGKDGQRDGKAGNPPPKMSEAEARRLLNSFADDEKKEQAERRKVIRARGGTEQDW